MRKLCDPPLACFESTHIVFLLHLLATLTESFFHGFLSQSSSHCFASYFVFILSCIGTGLAMEWENQKYKNKVKKVFLREHVSLKGRCSDFNSGRARAFSLNGLDGFHSEVWRSSLHLHIDSGLGVGFSSFLL